MQPLIDQALIAELASPGTDARCGVNLVCRPPPLVMDAVKEIQQRLRTAEPTQYYYPTSDLHLTVFEFVHSRAPDDAERISDKVQTFISALLHNLPQLVLTSPRLSFDSKACVLSFRCSEDLLAARRHLAERSAALGIPIDARHQQTSAHVTLLRYIKQLETDQEIWTDCVSTSLKSQALDWTVTELWLTSGANWYGMRSRITERGPYRLG